MSNEIYIPRPPTANLLTYQQALQARDQVKTIRGRTLDVELYIFCEVMFGERRESELVSFRAMHREKRLLLHYKPNEEQQLQLIKHQLIGSGLHLQLCRRQLLIAQMTDPSCLFSWSRQVYRNWQAEQWLADLKMPDFDVCFSPIDFNWSLVCRWDDILDTRIPICLDPSRSSEPGWLETRSQLMLDVESSVEMEADRQAVIDWLRMEIICQRETMIHSEVKEIIDNANLSFMQKAGKFGIVEWPAKDFANGFLESFNPTPLPPFPVESFYRFLRAYCLRRKLTAPVPLDPIFPVHRQSSIHPIRFYNGGYRQLLEDLAFRLYQERIQLMTNRLDNCFHLMDGNQWSVPFDVNKLKVAVNNQTNLSFCLPRQFIQSMHHCSFGFRWWANRDQFLSEVVKVDNGQDFFRFIVTYWMVCPY